MQNQLENRCVLCLTAASFTADGNDLIIIHLFIITHLQSQDFI